MDHHWTPDYTLSNNANINSHSSVKEAEMHRKEAINRKRMILYQES